MKDYQNALKLDDKISGFAYINLANKLYEENQTELAIKMCDEAISMSDNPVAYEIKGYILYSKGKQDEGIESVEKAVRYYDEYKMTEKIEQLHKDIEVMKRANHPLGKLIRWLT